MLSPADLENYWREGFVLVRDAFAAGEAEVWAAECDRLWNEVDLSGSRIQKRKTVDHELVEDRIDPVIDISPVFRKVTDDERVMGPVRAVLGVTPSLMKAKLIMKKPGTAGYDLHQDYPYWEFLGIPADEIMNVMMSIDPASPASGAIELFPRLHHQRIDPPPGEPFDADESKIDLDRGFVVHSTPRDLLLFHSMLPHRSGPNRSTRSRRTLIVTYTQGKHGDIYRRYHEAKNAGH